ncbi:hypothetical protein THAOC_34393 [Thalassiosira oceanica]|uniref:Uncharacterized protein n=1 Tax=Thalassiosira oceanica TaxID=159749 RepID=K0RCV6_THAOC|nr:hypothetical protein THAOC_34393 [Thalassiosira oceanica]|eukprot:EJK46921.1 hypothetical protein THAOC_34393 [Thalassiosira oceanica]
MPPISDALVVTDFSRFPLPPSVHRKVARPALPARQPGPPLALDSTGSSTAVVNVRETVLGTPLLCPEHPRRAKGCWMGGEGEEAAPREGERRGRFSKSPIGFNSNARISRQSSPSPVRPRLPPVRPVSRPCHKIDRSKRERTAHGGHQAARDVGVRPSGQRLVRRAGTSATGHHCRHP